MLVQISVDIRHSRTGQLTHLLSSLARACSYIALLYAVLSVVAGLDRVVESRMEFKEFGKAVHTMVRWSSFLQPTWSLPQHLFALPVA